MSYRAVPRDNITGLVLTLSPSPSGSRGSHAAGTAPGAERSPQLRLRGSTRAALSRAPAGLAASRPAAPTQRPSGLIPFQPCPAAPAPRPLPGSAGADQGLPAPGIPAGRHGPGHGEGAGCPRTHRSSDPTLSRATSMPARPRAAPVTALNEEQRAGLLPRPSLPARLPRQPCPARGARPDSPAGLRACPQRQGAATGAGSALREGMSFRKRRMVCLGREGERFCSECVGHARRTLASYG